MSVLVGVPNMKSLAESLKLWHDELDCDIALIWEGLTDCAVSLLRIA